jgi:uncharacterized protein YjiS (DUF1127 family)
MRWLTFGISTSPPKNETTKFVSDVTPITAIVGQLARLPSSMSLSVPLTEEVMQATLTQSLPLPSERTVQLQRSIRFTIAEWMRRVQQRRELIMLTDRDLCDIGITRLDASAEASKSFWQP